MSKIPTEEELNEISARAAKAAVRDLKLGEAAFEQDLTMYKDEYSKLEKQLTEAREELHELRRGAALQASVIEGLVGLLPRARKGSVMWFSFSIWFSRWHWLPKITLEKYRWGGKITGWDFSVDWLCFGVTVARP